MTLAPGLLSASEPAATALLLLAFGVLIAFSVLFSRFADRLGVPVVLLFLILGMLGGSEGFGRIAFDDYSFAVRLGTMALVLILFDGGFNTSVASIRQVLLPAGLLATVGVAATAARVAVFARWLGLNWPESLLLGAVVSSTDAAAVFAVLRGGGITLRPRVGRTLEVESCINDPMAVILTATIIQAIASAQSGEASASWHGLLLQVPLQLVVGCGVGIVFGVLVQLILKALPPPTVGLVPALTIAAAFVSFGAATLSWGSGFLAVFVTAVVLGSSSIPYHSGLARVHSALAWLSQIAMFLMLGLLVFPSHLLEVAGIGMGIALFLALVARPLAAAGCLLPLRYPLREIVYTGLVGLRGAVPIILATFPVLAQVQGAGRIFNIVFFVVVVSSLFPGTIIRWLARRLSLDQPQRPIPSAVLEINSFLPLSGEMVSFFIEKPVAVCGARLSEIEFPPAAAVVIIVRGSDLVAPKGSTVIEPGDHVYVYFRKEDRALIELLFGRREEGVETL
jgi:cell volume regulation protein A